AIAGQERHDAMGTGPHRDPRAVDDRGDVVGMGTLKLKRYDRPLVLGGAEYAKRIDLAQTLMSITREFRLVIADARLADGRDLIDGGARPDGLTEGGRAGLELMGRVTVGEAILKHFADHLATAVKRRHGGEMLVLAVKHPDAGRAVELVAGKCVEI